MQRVVQQKLGKILIDQGLVTEEQLKMALASQADSKTKRLGTLLVELGLVEEQQITEAVGLQFNMPVLSLKDINPVPELIRKVPRNYAVRFKVFPIFLADNEMTLAITDPTHIEIIDILSGVTGLRIQPVLAPPSEIEAAIKSHYPKGEEDEDSIGLGSIETEEITDAEVERLRQAGKEVPIVQLVDRVLSQAVEERASDIHFDPAENKLMVRFRVDGTLTEVSSVAMGLQPAITSRIKILSGLDIAERFKPQDGRLKLTIAKKDYDLRVSTLPTVHGEKIVMRILDRSNVQFTLADLGLSDPILRAFQKLIKQPYGLVLVTGPTGSGKTTTLYAALNAIKGIHHNIITVEDPVEYQLPLINQVQVNAKKNLTFATALRSILRQDPDIVLIGEIRDPETAAIATQAALTGHLVLATLHTNDAPGAITRLVDMGVDPFLLAPALLGVLAQRLVRKICEKCKRAYSPEHEELDRLGFPEMKDLSFYKGRGCAHCKQTGQKGRLGVHEVLVVDEPMRHLISTHASTTELRTHAQRNGFTDMRFDGFRKLAAGETTTEEVLMSTKGV